MSERSERVGRRATRRRPAALATVVTAERATTVPPRTRRPRWASSGERLMRPRSAAYGRCCPSAVLPTWRRKPGSLVRPTIRRAWVGGSTLTFRQIGGAPLLVGRGRRVLRRGGSRSLAATSSASAGVGGASSLRPWRSLRSLNCVPLLRTRNRCARQRRLRRSGSRSPAAVASLLCGQAPHCVRRGARSRFHDWLR